MVTREDLTKFFTSLGYKVILAAEGEPRIHRSFGKGVVEVLQAGGVGVALEPIALASEATYITRGRTEEDRKVLDSKHSFHVSTESGSYALKRLFFSENEFHDYYEGFANQTLWPLCHVAFEQPLFHKNWYEAFKRVNQRFADEIRHEMNGKALVWINDYQLGLVPKYLGKHKNTVVAFFWHIPWPTWEVFRILPQKKEILESLLQCDFLAFHRGYQVRNFLDTVSRELEARIDDETGRVYYQGHVTTVMNLPLGIDTDIVKSLIDKEDDDALLDRVIRKVIGIKSSEKAFDKFFRRHKVIIGVDRLDYTKGLQRRLQALERFFEKYRQYQRKVVYLGILAPSRENIPAYQQERKAVESLAREINAKYTRKNWKPIHLVYAVFPRRDIVNFYRRADLCLVTPRDDGMNLVSKEFVVASSFAKNPGMLVLSQFAGSAIDLTEALIVNPYDIDEVCAAIKKGLEMERKEKVKRTRAMAETMDEKNIYEWAELFVKNALTSVRA